MRAQTAPAQPLALSLRDAVRMAIAPQGNIAIDVASQSILYAEARLREAQTANRPDIDFLFTGQNQLISLASMGLRSIQIPGYTFPKSAGPYSVLDARVRIRKSLLDNASARRTDAVRASIETAKNETDEVKDKIAAKVALLYLSAQRSAAAVDTAQGLIASAEATLRETTARKAQDQALGVDVDHAKVALAAQNQHLAQAKIDLARAEIDLLSAINRDLDTPLSLRDPLTFTAQGTPAAAVAVSTALTSRSEIVTQKKRVSATRLNDVAIRAERLPTLTGYADAGTIGNGIPSSTGTYDVGVTLRIPVFDGGRRESRRNEVQVMIRQEELRVAQLEKQVELEVRQALLKMDIARGNVETANAQADVARAELEHRRRRFEQGEGLQHDVTDAQLILTKAEDDRVTAISAWNQTRIELMQAEGTIRNLAQ